MTTGQSQGSTRPLVSQRCDFNATGVRIHRDPDVNSTVLGEGNPGDGVAILASSGGDWVEITDERTGVTG
jgi:hypothetical protein